MARTTKVTRDFLAWLEGTVKGSGDWRYERLALTKGLFMISTTDEETGGIEYIVWKKGKVVYRGDKEAMGLAFFRKVEG